MSSIARSYYLAHPEEAPNRFAARLKRTLHLTDEQARKVQAIIDDRWPKFQETRRQMYPAFKDTWTPSMCRSPPCCAPTSFADWDEYIETIRKLWNPPPPTSAPATGAGAEAASAPSPGP